jgi:serine/threonine protein kinase
MSSKPSSPEPNDAGRGVRIGPYEILAHIASGGMGAVYRARHTHLGREVALKVLAPEVVATKPNVLERFRREAKAVSKLSHENIVTLFEFDQDRGTYYLAMELVEGVDLQGHLCNDLHDYISRRGKLSARRARKILIQAAHALEHAHAMGIVHRDIKPANFLLARRDGHMLVKLTDLGLAREASDEEFRVTREGSTVGSIDYMSPEQARDSGAADIRSDLYSLGCTLFHMLAGQPPFPEGGLTERLFKHIEAEPPDVRDFNPGVTPDLLRALRRLMAKKPEDRYQTPTELLEDLARGDQEEPPARDADEETEPVQEGPLPGPPSSTTVPTAGPPAALTPPRRRSGSSGSADSARTTPPRPTARPTPPPPEQPAPTPGLIPALSPEQQRAAAGQFARASQVLGEDNFDYAIQLLLSSCRLDPCNLAYRQKLRQTEKRKYHDNQRGEVLAWLRTLPTRARLRAARRAGDHLRVLNRGEDVLLHNPWDVPTQLAMSTAAEGLGLTDLAAWLLEEARQQDKHNAQVNRALARLEEKRGNLGDAVELWELVRKADPADAEAFQKINDLAAKDTIQRGRYLENLRGTKVPTRRSRE